MVKHSSAKGICGSSILPQASKEIVLIISWGESKDGAHKVRFQQKSGASRGSKNFRVATKKLFVTESVLTVPHQEKLENARVAEPVYAHDLKSCLARDVGSIPTPGTIDL